MNKYLIFRTDRIGDFLVTAILIDCIKKNDPSSNITLVASNKNYSYIKNFQSIDYVIEFKNDLLSKINLIFRLRKNKFHNIIIHDNKKRSKIISLFLRFKNKILVNDIDHLSHIRIIKNILHNMKFSFFEECLDTLKHIKREKTDQTIQLHFDEKWIYNNYIKKFVNIEPSKNELVNFIKEIQNVTKKEIIITSGFKVPSILKEILPTISRLKLKLYDNLNFSELETVTSKSNILISCHGAISHVAAACNIKQIDIIDRSYNYSRWTEHFRNYNYLYRDKFNLLAKKIIEKL